MTEPEWVGTAAEGPGPSRPPADPRSTSHAVTCDYLIGRGFRRCTCRGPRTRRR